MRILKVIFGLLACASNIAAVCPCDAASDVDALVERGLAARLANDDEGAFAAFSEAYAREPSPRILAQIGFAEQALSRWLLAERHVAGALADRERDAWVNQHYRTIASALETIREHIGTLELIGGAPGARVEIDGAEVGVLPLSKPLRVVSGKVVLTIHSAGSAPIARSIEILGGVTTRQRVELVPLASDPPAPLGTTAAPPVPVDRGGTLTTWAWVSAGAAAAGVAVGIVGTLVHADNMAQYNDDATCLAGPGTRQENCGGLRATGERAQTIATAGWVGGGLAALTSALLFYAARNDDDLPGIGVEVGSSQLTATIGGRF